MDPQLFDILRDMRKEITENHKEVVQRLTAVETRIDESPIKEFDERIKTLEGWRNKAAGFTIAINLFLAGAIEWIHSHAK